MSYVSKLSVFETQRAIKLIKNAFGDALFNKVNLVRISPPLLLEASSGLNDDLNYSQRPITFDLKAGVEASVVHSLAKWKRLALKKYGFGLYEGLYADMNAIRRDEDLGPLHSCYVDQWDFEKIIKEEDRNMTFLKSFAKDIYECIKTTERHVLEAYPNLTKKLPEEIEFVSSQQLEDEYPGLTPKEREYKCTEKYGAVFVTQVGNKLKSGEMHGGREADYDDWELNGDILVHFDALGTALELSSMGIRVTPDSLVKQLAERDALHRLNQPFHKTLLANELPYTIGGGVGQSRMCMYLLDKIHIGEVQASVWDQKTIEECEKNNITLL